MVKMVTISKEEQLEVMEVVACVSGSRVWETVRELMSEAFRDEYGRQVDFDYERISEKEREAFLRWLQEDE